MTDCLSSKRNSIDEHDAAGRFGNAPHRVRQVELREILDRGFHQPQRHDVAAALLENVHAEAADIRRRMREIDLVLLLQPRAQMRGDDVPEHRLHPHGGRRRRVHGHEFAGDAEDHRRVDFEMHV